MNRYERHYYALDPLIEQVNKLGDPNEKLKYLTDLGFVDDRGAYIDNPAGFRPEEQRLQKALAEIYYNQAVANATPESELPIGTPTDYIRGMEHAFDEYTRTDPGLMHNALYGYDPDGTAADWLSTVGDNRFSDIGKIHFGKFGYGEGQDGSRKLLPTKFLPGYYDQFGNRIRVPESSALQEIMNSTPVEPEYQEFEPGLVFPEVGGLSELAQRNINLRPNKLPRKAAPQERGNDYIEYLKDPRNKNLLDGFKVSMNLTPELVGTDDIDSLRSVMELYSAGAYDQGLGTEGVEMPTIGLEQVFQYSPERKTDQYVSNLRRLYNNDTFTPNLPTGYEMDTRRRGGDYINILTTPDGTEQDFSGNAGNQNDLLNQASIFANKDSVTRGLQNLFEVNPSKELLDRFS